MTDPTRIQNKLDDLKKAHDLLSERIKRVRHAFAVETDPSTKLKHETELKGLEADRAELEQQIAGLEKDLLAAHVQRDVEAFGLADQIKTRREDFIPLPEKLWERYEKLAFIGEGGMADVYRVRNRRVFCESALKVLKKKHHDDPRQIARFWAEGRVTGLVGSGCAQIVRVLNLGLSADSHFFIELEYLPGRTLDKAGLLKPAEALPVLRQLALAMQHIHAKSTVHRDLKPENLILADDGRLTLIDFGIARQLEDDHHLTKTMEFVGSLTCAAPEQFDADEFGQIGFCTDIYSFGIIAFWLLTGAPPFPTGRASALKAHCYTPLPKLPDTVPTELVELIRRCAAKSQAERCQTAAEILQVIDALLPATMAQALEQRLQALLAEKEDLWLKEKKALHKQLEAKVKQLTEKARNAGDKEQRWRKEKEALMAQYEAQLTDLRAELEKARQPVAAAVSETKPDAASSARRKVLRDTPIDKLTEDAVNAMLKTKDFFDKLKNSSGKGLTHEYEQQADGQIIYDRATDLYWQQGGSKETMTYDQVKKHIADLKAQNFGGYNDWRLPTLEEAMSLMEAKELNGNLYIDPLFAKTQSYCWTADIWSESDGMSSDASRAWVVYFLFGLCNNDDIVYYHCVRAVR